MYHRVKKYCKQHKMFERGSKIVVGVSGGPDSVCLLDMLCRMREEEEIQVLAVHIHHGLRGAFADRDEEFTKELCERLRVPYYCFHENVNERAKREKLSEEEAGRLCRYERMEQVRKETDANVIAVAHHENDQAETVLFHLVRGSGLEGLCGILPKRDRIIRPLLCLTREEVLFYLTKRNLSYQIDETNEEMIYTRNKIRNQWIPMFKEVNEEAVSHIGTTARLLQGATEFLKETCDKYYIQCVKEEKRKIIIEEEKIKQYHWYMQLEVLRKAFIRILEMKQKKQGGKEEAKKNIKSIHIESLKELLEGETGREIHLPKGIVAKKVYQSLQLTWEDQNEVPNSNSFSYEIELGFQGQKEVLIEPSGDRIRLEIQDISQEFSSQEKIAQIISKDTYKKMFDYDKIKGGLQLRTRKSQDKLTLNEEGMKKSLKRYFIDEKIPREEREKVPVLLDEQGVVWLIGYRIGAQYKVDTTTRRILLVEYEKKIKEKENG